MKATKMNKIKKDNYKELEKKVIEIVEGVYIHGKLTPNKSYGLPKGQLTEEEAVTGLLKLISLAEKKGYKKGFGEAIDRNKYKGA